MARASILTLEPIRVGGVPALAKAVYSLHAEHGHDVRLVYVDAESVPTDGWRSLLSYYRRHWRPRREVRRGMDGLSIPLFPLPQWAGSYAPIVFAPRELAADIRVVVTGSAHVGLPYTLSSRSFIVWVATRYGDELRGRAQAGDAWAQRILSGSQWPRLQAQEAAVLRRAARVIALSPYTAQRILEDFPELEGRVDTILYPVDMGKFVPAAGHRSNLMEAPYLLLTARILDPRKNVGMLFRAYARIRKYEPDLRLVLTGDMPNARVMQQLAEAGVREYVEFMGRVSAHELVKLYQGAELFVLPSTQEGLAISMLEAMACGLPVVATRCGGPEGVVHDGITGRLVPNDDAEAFAAAVLEILRDQELLREMRMEAAAYARCTYARPQIIAQLRHVFALVYPQFFAQPI